MFFKKKKSKNKSVEQLAEEGDAEACYQLGLKYFYGRDTDCDYKTAGSWLLKAAAGGCEKAYLQLGQIYEFGGYGVSQDHKKAVEYYLKSYEFCNEDDKRMVENSLGYCYYCLKDEENALRWARRCAKHGDSGDVSSFGAMLYDYKRYDEAFDVLKRAAELGDDYATFTLGECYFYGNGVAEDKQKAKELWIKAADEGLEDAENALKEYFGEEK